MKKTLFSLFAVLTALALMAPSCNPNAPIFGGSTTPTAQATAEPTEPAVAPAPTDTGEVKDNYDAFCPAPLDGPIAFDVLLNMDVGDPGLVSVVYAWDKINQSTAFVGVIDVMSNLDFENPMIQGQYLHFDTLNDAGCYAKQMAENAGTDNLIYVGSGSAPEGFSTSLPVTGWKMHVTVYTEAAIEVPNAVWFTFNVSNGDYHKFTGEMDWIYGQFWDGLDSSDVYHFTVEPGYLLTTPNFQGTFWRVAGGDPELLVKRFTQMTAEVIQRDDEPTVHQVYCGAEPKLIEGWTCSKN